MGSNNGLTLPHLFSDTDNQEDDALRNFIGLAFLCLVMVVITFYTWKICLFEKYGAYLPIDKNIDVQHLNKRKLFMSTKTYSVFTYMFNPLLEKLDMDYWCTHCGVDGYLYLLFQRRFFTLTTYMTMITFAA